MVTGIIEEGGISLNDEVIVFQRLGTTTKSVTVSGIEMERKMYSHAEKGDNVGLWLRDISKDDLSRGDILSKNIVIKGANNYRCEIYMRTKAEGGRPAPIFSNYMPQFRFDFDESEVTGVITLSDDMEMCMPGNTAHATVTFQTAMVLTNGEHFLIVEGKRKDKRIVGSGVVLAVAE